MSATQETLFALFERLGIATQTVEHPPMFTVEEGRAWESKIPGLSCKNLFLKDKKGQLWLVVMPGEKRAHLARIEKAIGSGRLSFGRPELLQEVLGIAPGSVTPFALMNDTTRRVTVVLDKDMMATPMVSYHPLRNTATTVLKSEDLLKFIKHLSYSPLIVDCGDWIEAGETV